MTRSKLVLRELVVTEPSEEGIVDLNGRLAPIALPLLGVFLFAVRDRLFVYVPSMLAQVVHLRLASRGGTGSGLREFVCKQLRRRRSDGGGFVNDVASLGGEGGRECDATRWLRSNRGTRTVDAALLPVRGRQFRDSSDTVLVRRPLPTGAIAEKLSGRERSGRRVGRSR